MATEVVTLSDLAVPQETRPKPNTQDISGHSQNDIHTGASRRTTHESQIASTSQDDNNATTTSRAPSNAHTIDDQSSRLPFGRLMVVYACLATAYATSTLDIIAVASALPVIGSSLDAGTTITWAGTAYLMGQAACQPLYGRLSDVFGRKPVLMLSLAFIVIGGLLCGFAQTPTWLYVCRALSGVGGGGVSSVVAIIISDLVSMRDRGKYQGLLSVAIGLGACAGPFIAAEMLKRGGEAWRWIFWVSPILASVCLVVMWFLLPLKPVTGSWGEKVRKIDWFGVVVAVVAMVFLLVSWFLVSRLIRGMVWLTRSVAAHQLRRIDVALEQRHGDIDALHRRCELASVLLYPETSSQDPHYPSTTFHPKINFGLVTASTMLRLRLASRPLFLATLLSGCSRLHAASVSNPHVAVARDA